MRYQPEEDWSAQKKQERREQLDRIERIARIVFPLISVLSIGFLFWELHVYSAKYLSLSDHLHSRPAWGVFAIMAAMSCVLLYIMFQAFLAHRDKKTVYSGEQTRQEPMSPLPPLEPSRPPPSETRASFSARSPDLGSTDRQIYLQPRPLPVMQQQAPVMYQVSRPSTRPSSRESSPTRYVQQ